MSLHDLLMLVANGRDIPPIEEHVLEMHGLIAVLRLVMPDGRVRRILTPKGRSALATGTAKVPQ
jgi:hypothetical protein